MTARKRRTIGFIGVDAGLCYLGDPCYIIDAQYLGKMTWRDFLEKYVPDAGYPVWKVPHRGVGSSQGSLGIIVATGDGDGVYPVEVEQDKDGRVRRVIVTFGRR